MIRAGARGAAVALAAGAALAMATPAGAAELSGCQLAGTAAFVQGLNTTAKNFDYSFSGSLTECRSTTSGRPASGTVVAGERITIDNVQYMTPVPTGAGSCASSDTRGTSIITWADGTVTILDYTTRGVLSAVHLSGTVRQSLTLSRVDGLGTRTISTTRFSGFSTNGLLRFSPPDPAACNTTTGVKSAAISGVSSLSSTA